MRAFSGGGLRAPLAPSLLGPDTTRACGVLGHTPAKGMGIKLYCSPHHGATQ